MSQMRRWVIKRGEKYLTPNGGWSKDVAKSRTFKSLSDATSAMRGRLERPVNPDMIIEPHWVSGEAW